MVFVQVKMVSVEVVVELSSLVRLFQVHLWFMVHFILWINFLDT